MDEFGFINILFISFPLEFYQESKDFARNESFIKFALFLQDSLWLTIT